MKKLIASAVTAAFITFGAAGVASAAPTSDGSGGIARVKAAKTVYDTNGLRRTPRMWHGSPVLVPDARPLRGRADREAADFVAVPAMRRRIT